MQGIERLRERRAHPRRPANSLANAVPERETNPRASAAIRSDPSRVRWFTCKMTSYWVGCSL